MGISPIFRNSNVITPENFGLITVAVAIINPNRPREMTYNISTDIILGNLICSNVELNMN